MGDEKLGGPGQLVVTGQADLVQPVGKMLVKIEMIIYDDGDDYDDHDYYDHDYYDHDN